MRLRCALLRMIWTQRRFARIDVEQGSRHAVAGDVQIDHPVAPVDAGDLAALDSAPLPADVGVAVRPSRFHCTRSLPET
jgi:hypothetical protein